MAQRVFQQSYRIPGTLAANVTIVFTAPFDCQLIHVSSVASNDSDATLKVGTTTDDDAYITEGVIGDSNVPVEKEALTDFAGATAANQYPHIPDGTVVQVTLDYNGAAGTAADDVTIVLTLTEG